MTHRDLFFLYSAESSHIRQPGDPRDGWERGAAQMRRLAGRRASCLHCLVRPAFATFSSSFQQTYDWLDSRYVVGVNRLNARYNTKQTKYSLE